MNCIVCGHYDLTELGVLGRRVHYRCRACGMDQSLVGFSQARLEELSRQHRMDGGGYCWDNAEIEPFAELGCVAWDDPDFDYLTGETPAEARGESCVFFWAVGEAVEAWPASYVVEHQDGPWVYARVETGSFYERDVECDCHGKPAGKSNEWEFTGNSLDDAWPDCPWCEGDGVFDGEGGDYAVYVLRDLERLLEPLARELAQVHAESPEVREAGGPAGDDADSFPATALAERLREAGLPDAESLVEELRETLRAELEELEVEAEDEVA